jgi:AraC-like DNA-binding protein
MQKPLSSPLLHFYYAGKFAGEQDVEFHAHPAIEFVLVTEGTCAIDMGGNSYEGETDTLFIIPPDMAHNQREKGFVRATYMVFAADATFLTVVPRALRLKDAAREIVPGCIESLCRLAEKNVDVYMESVDALLYSIVSFVKKYQAQVDGQRQVPEALERALSYINESINKPVSMQELSSRACVSISYLTALFRQNLGISPVQYIISARLNLAGQMLKNPYLTIKECAQKCGFDDANYFSRLFHRHSGYTPGQYRKFQLHYIKSPRKK